MTWLQEMCQFVDDDVLQTRRRKRAELQIEPYPPRPGVARAPPRAHTPNSPLDRVNLHPISPRSHDAWEERGKLFAMPSLKRPSPIVNRGARVYTKLEHLPVTMVHARMPGAVQNAQLQVRSPKTV